MSYMGEKFYAAVTHIECIPLQWGQQFSTCVWHYCHITEEGKVLNGLYLWEIKKTAFSLLFDIISTFMGIPSLKTLCDDIVYI